MACAGVAADCAAVRPLAVVDAVAARGLGLAGRLIGECCGWEVMVQAIAWMRELDHASGWRSHKTHASS